MNMFTKERQRKRFLESNFKLLFDDSGGDDGDGGAGGGKNLFVRPSSLDAL